MRHSNEQKIDNAEDEQSDLSILDVQISDLPPDTRSHYLLLRLLEINRRGQSVLQMCTRSIQHSVAALIRRDDGREQTEDERLVLEISDLPPTTRSHHLLLRLTALKAHLFHRRSPDKPRTPLTRTQRRLRIGRALTVLGLCASLTLLLIGNAPDLRTQLLTLLQPVAPTATPITAVAIFPLGPGVPIVVERHGLPEQQTQSTPGPLPAICPQATTLQSFMTPLDPPGLGDGPVWITGFVGPTASLVDLQPLGTSLSHPQGQTVGWYEGLAVFVQRGFTGTITLQGENQGSSGSVFFAGNNVLDFGSVFHLDLSTLRLHSFPSGSQWQVTSLNLIVPFAGCYGLQAFWNTGTWSRYFAAGS
jgi:hypothetical protein